MATLDWQNFISVWSRRASTNALYPAEEMVEKEPVPGKCLGAMSHWGAVLPLQEIVSSNQHGPWLL